MQSFLSFAAVCAAAPAHAHASVGPKPGRRIAIAEALPPEAGMAHRH